ncbi:deoxyguanosinetriphosphate triphosphohydrolase [Alphaproteobacteria bacterium]|nr:deoxyguanosinetriphosphate triphosphohydrolase [Alphaproteobacteria bacterium]
MSTLASYAVDPTKTRGRAHLEPGSDGGERSPHQRDRDRIIHSRAFRKLLYKTQVFVSDENDTLRTRLTHSMEVAQITRDMCRALCLNEDLGETVALAHDLGHSPFGHTGEDALTDCLNQRGLPSFNHNLHTAKIVTVLERRYAAYDGLNLCWETLEGIAKHNGPVHGDLAADMERLFEGFDLELHTHASAEAQVAALSDDIAYNTHDVDDGLRAGMLDFADLAHVALPARALKDIDATFPGLPADKRAFEVARRMISELIGDVLSNSRGLLAPFEARAPEDIRTHDQPVIAFSPSMYEDLQELRAFLFAHLYRHPQVNRRRHKTTKIIKDLFDLYDANPSLLLSEKGMAEAIDDPVVRAGIVTDTIASMTDKSAIEEHRRQFDLYAID